MSSSSDLRPRASRVLRGVTAPTSPVGVDDVSALVADVARRGDHPVEVPPEIVEAAREAAREDGYADGYRTGVEAAQSDGAAAQRRRAEEVGRALDALAAAAAECRARHELQLAGLEDQIAELAYTVVESLLGRELELADSPGRDAVARALALAEGWDALRVRLHPEDVATVGMLDDLAPGRDVSVVPDASVELGGCIIEAGHTRIDAQLGPALERVRRALVG